MCRSTMGRYLQVVTSGEVDRMKILLHNKVITPSMVDVWVKGACGSDISSGADDRGAIDPEARRREIKNLLSTWENKSYCYLFIQEELTSIFDNGWRFQRLYLAHRPCSDTFLHQIANRTRLRCLFEESTSTLSLGNCDCKPMDRL